MNKIKTWLKNLFRGPADSQAKGAQEAMLQEIFHDMYRERGRIYKVNFIRGIFFGLGSALGGTLIIALIFAILTLFIDIPLLGDLFREARSSLGPSE